VGVEIVFLENAKIENNITEFALARIVAQLILWDPQTQYLQNTSIKPVSL
jgi:hypothetical protein